MSHDPFGLPGQTRFPPVAATWDDRLRSFAVTLVLLVGWTMAVRSGWEQGGILGALVAGIAGLVVVPLAALIGWIVLWNLVELLCLPGKLLALRLEWRPDTHPLGWTGLQLASLLLFGSIAYPLIRAVPDWLAWSLFGGVACVIFTFGGLIFLFIALLLWGRGVRKGSIIGLRNGIIIIGDRQTDPAGRFRDDSDPDDPGGPILEVEPEPPSSRRLPPPDAPAGS